MYSHGKRNVASGSASGPTSYMSTQAAPSSSLNAQLVPHSTSSGTRPASAVSSGQNRASPYTYSFPSNERPSSTFMSEPRPRAATTSAHAVSSCPSYVEDNDVYSAAPSLTGNFRQAPPSYTSQDNGDVTTSTSERMRDNWRERSMITFADERPVEGKGRRPSKSSQESGESNYGHGHGVKKMLRRFSLSSRSHFHQGFAKAAKIKGPADVSTGVYDSNQEFNDAEMENQSWMVRVKHRQFFENIQQNSAPVFRHPFNNVIYPSTSSRHDTPSPPTGPVPGRGLTQPPIFPADPNQGASARAAAALQNEQHHTAKPQMVDLQRRDTAKSSRVVVLPRDADSGVWGVAGVPAEDVSDSVAHMPRVDPVSYLPVELTALVFENLDAKSLARAQCVSKTWHHAAMSRHVWREVFLARYLKKPAVSPPPPQIGGKGIGKRRPEQDWQRMHKARKIIDRNWNAGDGKAIYMAGHTDSVYCVQFDEEKIITGSRDRTIRVWDINTYKCLRVIGGPATRPVPGPKELKAVEPPFLHHVEPSVNGTPAGDSIFHVPSDYHSASILCLQYDDEIMVTGSSDSTLIVWDIKTYEPIKRLVKHASGVLDVAFDDNYIVSCSKDSTITIWDRKTLEPKQVLHGHKGPVNAVQLRGNLLVSASGDGIAKLWNLGNGTGPAHPVREFNSKDRGLAAVEFSEDANYVLAGGNDHITYKFDTNTGAEVHTYLGHTNLVRSLYLDAHNNRVISGSYDLSLRVYDYADDPAQGQRGGREIAVFPEWTTSWMLAAKSDYRRIVSTSQDGRILMIDFGLDVDGAEMLEGRCS